MTVDLKTGKTTPTLYWTLDGKAFPGWIDVTITRSIESCPMTLTALVSEQFPGAKPVLLTAGQKIVVKDDQTTVFTGWVDGVSKSFGPRGTSMQISCRSLCEDIVDSTNLFASNMISATSVIEYAEKLCKPFGITVKDETNGQSLPAIPNIPLSLTDRVFSLIERIAGFSGVLVYDNEFGELVIASIGKNRMAGSLKQGDNILQASMQTSLAQRFSEYKFVWQASNYSYGQVSAVPQTGYATDPVLQALKRVRPFVGVSNQADLGGHPIAQQRAQWEANRRLGRGYALRCSVSGWHDSKGALWRPNAHVTVEMPALGLSKQDFIISEVSNRRSIGEGAITEMTLYPPQAFSIEPIAVLDPIQTLVANPDTPSGTAETASDGRRDKG